MKWVAHPIYNLNVSDTGLVQGPKGLRIPRKDRDGYLRLNIWYKGKLVTKQVHRLVADCFCISGTGSTIDHVDGDKTNNAVGNLQWMLAGDNCSKSFKQGLRRTQCRSVVVGGVEYYSKREAERRTGIPRHTL